jgi:hypothetical protein
VANYNDTCLSNELNVIAKSGLRGFYISEDNNANGVPDTSSASLNTVFRAAIDSQLITYNVLDSSKYIHIRAIDSAGNLNAVVTLSPVLIPAVSITGSNSISVGATTQLSPANGGTWVSNNPGVASVTNGGLVTGLAAGNVTFSFTPTGSACSATTTELIINPRRKPSITIGVRKH